MTKELSEVEILAIQAADAAFDADYKDSKWHGLLAEDCNTLAMVKGEEAYAAVFAEHGVEPANHQMYWRVRDRRATEFIAREDARLEREWASGIAEGDGFSGPRI
ncbi:hypothetical protein [Rhizobium sp. MHM7A]|uniref:hypothetical protein n=1 Tax=Rhizobium sp. MHM7A TaxID=2583233 RepID=UPI001106E52E|nr:hypothetical protein [Rhizobium sp. MHM7A]TLX16257.1 hypothetical protein FFR93_02710 [Rhizobium sp. MHM7A]